MAHSPLHRPHFSDRLAGLIGAGAAAPARAGSPRKRSLQALRLTVEGRPLEALAEADAVVREVPGSAAAHHARAIALGALGRVREASVAAEAATRLEPADPMLRMQAGSLALRAAGPWSRRTRAVEALEHAEQGLEADPQHAGCRYIKAGALALLGHAEEAEQAYRRTLALDLDRATRATVLVDLAGLLCGLGRLDEARERLDAALLLQPGRDDLRAARQRLDAAPAAPADAFDRLLTRLDLAQADQGGHLRPRWSMGLPLAALVAGCTLAARAAAGSPSQGVALLPLGLVALFAAALVAGHVRRVADLARPVALIAALGWLMASGLHLIATPAATPLAAAAQLLGLLGVAGLGLFLAGPAFGRPADDEPAASA